MSTNVPVGHRVIQALAVTPQELSRVTAQALGLMERRVQTVIAEIFNNINRSFHCIHCIFYNTRLLVETIK